MVKAIMLGILQSSGADRNETLTPSRLHVMLLVAAHRGTFQKRDSLQQIQMLRFTRSFSTIADQVHVEVPDDGSDQPSHVIRAARTSLDDIGSP
jgi:hypothetical protein